MKSLYELKEKLQHELDEIARKPEMSAGDLETVHKLTDTVKNIDKICALEEDGGYSGIYSRDGDWENRSSYDRDSSYRRRDSMGRYARNGYSRHDARGSMREKLIAMMDEATTERDREAIRRCIDELN